MSGGFQRPVEEVAHRLVEHASESGQPDNRRNSVVGLPARNGARIDTELHGDPIDRVTRVPTRLTDAVTKSRRLAFYDILCHGSDAALYTMTMTRQDEPTTESPHFATLLVMALDPKEIGERIASRRKELGWTHQRLADVMNVELRTVQRWQEGIDAQGKSLLPRLHTLMDLAEKMGVERSYFVEGQAAPDTQPGLLKDVADGVEQLERSSEDVLGRLDEALARLERIEAAVLPPGETRRDQN